LHSFGFAIGLAQALADKGKCVQFAVGKFFCAAGFFIFLSGG